jgi:hypothetical protein
VADQFQIEKIHDSAWVFKNAIKNSKELIKYFNECQPWKDSWKDWYTFGKMADIDGFEIINFEKFPTREEWEKSKHYGSYGSSETDFGQRYYFENQINDLFYEVTKIYIEENKVELDNWVFEAWNIAKYIPHKDHRSYAMMHHTDFQREIAYNPGLKFGITAVIYLNDDYEGGEVEYRFLDEKDPSVVLAEYTYKPSEGDIVVFASGPPHYHGVRGVTSGEKYIIRSYWRYDYPGHPLWLRLQEKYGKDLWRELEEKRLKGIRDQSRVRIINNAMFWTEFEDYYKKEIESLGL